jgi:hypothetical protein
MVLIRIVFFALVALFGALIPASAQSVTAVPCIDTCTGNLRSLTTSPGNYVIAAGYRAPGDGAGGTFYALDPSVTSCATVSQTGASWLTTDPNTITITNPLNVSIGMAITPGQATSGLPAYDTVVSTSPTTIRLASPITISGALPTIYFSNDNGGSVVRDNETTPVCYNRTSWTYSQKEWGAYSDGTDDDTAALQNWMNAPQPHIAVPGNSRITETLACGLRHAAQSGIIQGSPTQAVGQGSAGVVPTFTITADNSAYGGFTNSAMLIMESDARCAIHAVGLIADSPATGNIYDTVLVKSEDALIDDHSLLFGGRYNLLTQHPHANLEIYDSSISSAKSDNLHITSANVKIARNAISLAGQDNVSLSGTSDTMIVDNNIQIGARWGINADLARQVRATGNFIDDNALGGIQIQDSGVITFCSNVFHRNGATNEGTSTATSHIYFAGRDDSISLCGNTFLPGPDVPSKTDIAMRPDYVYDADPAAVLTNIAIADNPAPQNKGVFSTNGTALLASAASPHPAINYISGLTLSNGSSAAAVNITAGEATDSTGTTILRSPPGGCTVDLTTNGVGGLDTGSPAIGTTYYFFLIAGSGGANPHCIASTLPNPSLLNTGSYYTLTEPGNVTSGSFTIFNVGGPTSGSVSYNKINPVSAMSIGDPVAIGTGSPANNIGSLTSFYTTLMGDISSGSDTIQNVSSPGGILVGMLVGNPPGTANPPIIAGTTVLNVCGTTCYDTSATPCTPSLPDYCILLSQSTHAPGGTSLSITFSGNYTITLGTGSAPTTTVLPATLTVYHGLHRLIGAVYTKNVAGVPTLVSFAQQGNTFYLNAPQQNTFVASPTPSSAVLTGVPGGISVKAFGRCVGGAASGTASHVMLYSPLQSSGTAHAFPNPPGFIANSLATTTAYSFSAYTDTSKALTMSSDVMATQIECMTDGWVLDR